VRLRVTTQGFRLKAEGGGEKLEVRGGGKLEVGGGTVGGYEHRLKDFSLKAEGRSSEHFSLNPFSLST